MHRVQKSHEKASAGGRNGRFDGWTAKKELKEGGVVLHDGHSGPILTKSG